MSVCYYGCIFLFQECIQLYPHVLFNPHSKNRMWRLPPLSCPRVTCPLLNKTFKKIKGDEQHEHMVCDIKKIKGDEQHEHMVYM
jgi:hypothetical protein